nr:hypothetical protein [Tanacetum cinerariifolium]
MTSLVNCDAVNPFNLLWASLKSATQMPSPKSLTQSLYDPDAVFTDGELEKRDCVENQNMWNNSGRTKERDEEIEMISKDNVNDTGGEAREDDDKSENKNVAYANMVKKDAVPKNLNYIPTMVTDIGSEVVIFDEIYNIRRMWGKFGIAYIDAIKAGHYVFKFRDRMEPKKLPVWVKIVNVPLEARFMHGISALASSLGKHIMMDTMTANMCYKGVGNLEYARVLVEMKPDKEIKKEMEIQYRDKNNNIKGRRVGSRGNEESLNSGNDDGRMDGQDENKKKRVFNAEMQGLERLLIMEIIS